MIKINNKNSENNVFTDHNNKYFKNIVIHGYYGAGNFGDDIILLSIINMLYETIADIKITVLSRDICPIPEGISPFQVVSRFDIEKVIKLIKEADLLICGGGGLLQDYSGFDILDHFSYKNKGINYYAVPIEIAYILGKPAMLYAIGVGPLFNQQSVQYIRTILNWVKVVTVRDKESKELLDGISSNANVTITADPAVNYYNKLIQSDSNNSKNSDNKNENFPTLDKENIYIGICLRNWFFDNNSCEHFVTIISNIINFIITQFDYKIILFPFNNCKSDAKLLGEIYNDVDVKDSVYLVTDLNMSQTVELIKNIEFLIGMRLHSLITATVNNKPIIGISYDQKISNYMTRLELGDYCIDLNNINIENFEYIVTELIRNKDCLKSKIKTNVRQMQEYEKENSLLASKLLRDGNNNYE